MNSRMIVLSLIGILLGRALDCCAQQKAGDIPPPTYQNVKYAEHKHNVLDFWQASADKPAALVLFFHGGGFAAGPDKSLLTAQYSQEVKKLLDANISVASVDYRFVEEAKSFPAHFHDCRRALQFLRSKADDWKIDRSRVGAFGQSGGAVICMYLAFHDEMADPSSSDPIARESTRLNCVAVGHAQTTIDYQWWEVNIPGQPSAEAKSGGIYERYGLTKKDYFHSRFGVTTREEFLKKQSDFSALSLVSRDDPPIYLYYSMAPGSQPPTDQAKVGTWRRHHVIMGVKLKEKLDALGVEAHLEYPEGPTEKDSPAAFLPAAFLIEKLTDQH